MLPIFQPIEHCTFMSSTGKQGVEKNLSTMWTTLLKLLLITLLLTMDPVYGSNSTVSPVSTQKTSQPSIIERGMEHIATTIHNALSGTNHTVRPIECGRDPSHWSFIATFTIIFCLFQVVHLIFMICNVRLLRRLQVM